MRRFRKHMFEENAQEFSADDSYTIAYKKVKRIKGFYKHLKIYFIVNAILIISSLNRGFIGNHFQVEGLLEWHTYSTAVFWGIGLLAHGLLVFGPDWFFGKGWEQSKIQKYMENEKANTNKWE